MAFLLHTLRLVMNKTGQYFNICCFIHHIILENDFHKPIQHFVFPDEKISLEIIAANDSVGRRKCSVLCGHAPLSIPRDPWFPRGWEACEDFAAIFGKMIWEHPLKFNFHKNTNKCQISGFFPLFSCSSALMSQRTLIETFLFLFFLH